MSMFDPAPWYDDAISMTRYCHDIEKFKELLNARAAACISPEGDKKAKLTKFIVNGVWFLDEFGQIGTLVGVENTNTYTEVDRKDWPIIPKVIQADKFLPLIAESMKPKLSYTRTFGSVPVFGINANVKCSCCGKAIILEDLSDVVSKNNEFLEYDELLAAIPTLNELSVKDVELAYSSIDGELAYINLCDKNLPISRENFVRIYTSKVIHKKCHEKKMTGICRREFNTALEEAGIEIYGSIRIPNEYGSESYRGPWFIFDTSIGNIKIGWRKRVINIDYSDIDKTYVSKTEESKGPGWEHVTECDCIIKAVKDFKEFLDGKVSQ